MLSQIIFFTLWALCSASADLPGAPSQDEAGTSDLTRINISQPQNMTPGKYQIAQGPLHLLVYQREAPVLAIGWSVESIGNSQFQIVSTMFGQPAARGADHNRVVLSGSEQVPSIWAFESVGKKQLVVKIPDLDAVWKHDKQGNWIEVVSAHGSSDEHWEFTPVEVKPLLSITALFNMFPEPDVDTSSIYTCIMFRNEGKPDRDEEMGRVGNRAVGKLCRGHQHQRLEERKEQAAPKYFTGTPKLNRCISVFGSACGSNRGNSANKLPNEFIRNITDKEAFASGSPGND
ncbi:hypothetical protein B0H13DRAFT_1856784 [Mycena leptocephala]|nr:hypothetical protein B0H13DRAFT_1856784 [Mycena leptocephala]